MNKYKTSLILAAYLLKYVSSQESQSQKPKSSTGIIPLNRSDASGVKLRRISSLEESSNVNNVNSGRVIQRNFIDLSQILSMDTYDQINELQVQLMEGDEPILFKRLFSTNDNSGYYWYGENDGKGGSSISFQVKGDICVG